MRWLPPPLPRTVFMVGWGHHGWGHGGFGFGGIYVNTGVSDCYQQQYIQTRHGVRLRTVNVCGYNRPPDRDTEHKTPIAG